MAKFKKQYQSYKPFKYWSKCSIFYTVKVRGWGDKSYLTTKVFKCALSIRKKDIVTEAVKLLAKHNIEFISVTRIISQELRILYEQ